MKPPVGVDAEEGLRRCVQTADSRVKLALNAAVLELRRQKEESSTNAIQELVEEFQI